MREEYSPSPIVHGWEPRRRHTSRGITVWKTISPKKSRTSLIDLVGQFEVGSYIVNRMPPNFSRRGGRFITWRITSIICVSPSMAKYSHWIGISTSVEAGQRRAGQVAQRRRAIDQHEVVGRHARGQMLLERGRLSSCLEARASTSWKLRLPGSTCKTGRRPLLATNL